MLVNCHELLHSIVNFQSSVVDQNIYIFIKIAIQIFVSNVQVQVNLLKNLSRGSCWFFDDTKWI
jgi:hypothetical protein